MTPKTANFAKTSNDYNFRKTPPPLKLQEKSLDSTSYVEYVEEDFDMTDMEERPSVAPPLFVTPDNEKLRSKIKRAEKD
jgi:hypothetical protein